MPRFESPPQNLEPLRTLVPLGEAVGLASILTMQRVWWNGGTKNHRVSGLGYGAGGVVGVVVAGGVVGVERWSVPSRLSLLT